MFIVGLRTESLKKIAYYLTSLKYEVTFYLNKADTL
jgi:hypothetical protein